MTEEVQTTARRFGGQRSALAEYLRNDQNSQKNTRIYMLENAHKPPHVGNALTISAIDAPIHFQPYSVRSELRRGGADAA